MKRQLTSISELYGLLFNEFGQQGWWPARNTVEMIVGMVLVQNTSWNSVTRSLDNLYKATGFDLDRLLTLSQEQMQLLIIPSGFYRRKSECLRDLLLFYRDYYDDLKKNPTDQLRKLLLEINGIGNETADVLLLYLFNRLVFVADNYAMSMFANLCRFSKRPAYAALKNVIEGNLDLNIMQAKEFHALIVAYGKRYSSRPDEGFLTNYYLKIKD